MDHITELFCILDDFCKKFNESLEKALISNQKTRLKKSALTVIKHGHRSLLYLY